MGPLKQCLVCGDVKSVELFHLRKGMRDGRANQCKDCHFKAAEKRRKANLEHDRDLHAAWRANNPDRVKASRKRAYEKSLKNGTAEDSRTTRQARVKAARTGGVVSLKAVLATHGMVCSICTKVIGHNLQLSYDHVIPLARGGAHTEENLRPAHRACNSWKCDRLPEELVGLTPPELGVVTEDDAYHVLKINAAKSASHKKRFANMTLEEKAERQAKISAGVTQQSLAKRKTATQAAWANKTPEEREAWAAKCRAIKAGSPGNLENLKKGWTPEVHAKAIQASADARRGVPETLEQRAAISEGLKRAYSEGRRT